MVEAKEGFEEPRAEAVAVATVGTGGVGGARLRPYSWVMRKGLNFWKTKASMRAFVARAPG